MKKKDNNVLTKIKSLDKKHLIVYLAVFICAIVFIGTSYAWFSKTDALKDFQIVVDDLRYTLESDALNSANQVTVESGATKAFDILVTSNNPVDTKYQMVYSSSNNLTDVEVGYSMETTDASSGTVAANSSKTISVIINNNSTSSVTIQFNIRGGLKNNEINDIILASSDTKLDVGLEAKIYDITIASVTIDGEEVTSLPQSGTYTLSSYNCTNNSSLSWNTYTKSITFGTNSTIGEKGESCSLNFTQSTNYPLLVDVVKQGDYIAYEGANGCLKGGTATATITTSGQTIYENSNSCLGYNANANSDGSKDSANGMYGYCNSTDYRYYVRGWRIAYTDSNRAYIISAGSPECTTRRNSTNGNEDYISDANLDAKKYCNSSFVDDCTSDTDVHAINDTDFNKITAQLTGTTGGYLYTSITGATKCGGVYSTQGCGYNNDLIDIGANYWYAVGYLTTSTNGVYWNAYGRVITQGDSTSNYGLRPVIRLSSNIYITGGSGTMDDPYTITRK